MLAALLLVQNIGFPFSRWIFLLLGMLSLAWKKQLVFERNEPPVLVVVVLAYLPVIIIGFLFSEDLSLSFDILSNAFYSFFGILVISQASVNWQTFTKFHGFVTIFIIIAASILIYYSSHGSNTGVRNLGLSGNDNRLSSLLIICLVVISNVLPRIVNWFLGGLLFFAFISINARGAIISLILWPILEEIFKRTHDQRARVALGMLLYFIFCVGYFAMIHILEDKSSNIRVGLGVDVLVSMSMFQFALVESHFSLISFFQYFGPFLFIILFLLFWFKDII